MDFDDQKNKQIKRPYNFLKRKFPTFEEKKKLFEEEFEETDTEFLEPPSFKKIKFGKNKNLIFEDKLINKKNEFGDRSEFMNLYLKNLAKAHANYFDEKVLYKY